MIPAGFVVFPDPVSLSGKSQNRFFIPRTVTAAWIAAQLLPFTHLRRTSHLSHPSFVGVSIGN